MARSRFEDMMQAHRFWLIDIMPSMTVPFFVLGSPLYGFSSISSPEYNFEMQTIKQGNSMFDRTTFAGGSMSPITLSRGCRAWDDTFYQWVKNGIRGNDMVNRDLLLIHYTGIGVSDSNVGEDISAIWTFGASKKIDFGPGDIVNLPGRAWILWDVLPTRYKAGSDFDATSAEVSIMELDVQPVAFEEITLM